MTAERSYDMDDVRQEVRDARSEMNRLHGDQARRMETLTKDVNAGFEKLRSEMAVQNGRVGTSEKGLAVLAERLVPIQRLVYGVVGLLGAGFIGALMALAFSTKGHP